MAACGQVPNAEKYQTGAMFCHCFSKRRIYRGTSNRPNRINNEKVDHDVAKITL